VYLTMAAQKSGADASLQVCPYYNKPTQEGLLRHFEAIARTTRLPIVLYNIPSRCGVEIAVETVRNLAASCKNVVGIKEAGGNPDRVTQLIQACGPRFSVFSGDDSLTLPFMAVGAVGVVSVASNLIPREVARMVRAFRGGRIREAQRLHARYASLFKHLFIETNPAPVKAALGMLGWIQEDLRLPLVPISATHRGILRETLKQCGLLRS
jgi:4-hydroxy-tetrahydrodipicolinate synthase